MQPDVCVICDPSKIDVKGAVGAPDIVVEILSPANNRKELKNMYEVYEQAGVKEYWLVSPQDYTCLVYMLVEGQFVPSRLMGADDILTLLVLPGFPLDRGVLFDNLIGVDNV